MCADVHNPCTTSKAHVIKDTFKLQTASYGGLSGMPMSAKIELESDMTKRIALLVIHSVRLKNSPVTIEHVKGKGGNIVTKKKLHEKKDLDKSPPGLEFQQLDLVLMRDVNRNAARKTAVVQNADGEDEEVELVPPRRDILISISKDSESSECDTGVATQDVFDCNGDTNADKSGTWRKRSKSRSTVYKPASAASTYSAIGRKTESRKKNELLGAV